jgi:dihydroneopterin aldolase
MEFFAHHGCYEEEQIIGNHFLVDFFCEVDTSEAEQSDELLKTVDYQAIYQLIKEEMAINSKLLEHLALRIINRIMKTFPSIEESEVRISKMNPPVGGKVERVSVALSSSEVKF